MSPSSLTDRLRKYVLVSYFSHMSVCVSLISAFVGFLAGLELALENEVLIFLCLLDPKPHCTFCRLVVRPLPLFCTTSSPQLSPGYYVMLLSSSSIHSVLNIVAALSWFFLLDGVSFNSHRNVALFYTEPLYLQFCQPSQQE